MKQVRFNFCFAFRLDLLPTPATACCLFVFRPKRRLTIVLIQLLEKAVLCRTSQDFGMDNVKQVHLKIQEQIANSQAKTTRILEEHEKVSAAPSASSSSASRATPSLVQPAQSS